jgi:hypothetical protein
MKETLNNLVKVLDLRESEIMACSGLVVGSASAAVSTQIDGAWDVAQLCFAFTFTAIGRDVGFTAVKVCGKMLRRKERYQGERIRL